MPWYVRNFHIYKEIELPRWNDFIQHLNLNFHLALENTDSIALNAFAAYDHYDLLNRKCRKTGLRLNTVLWSFFCVQTLFNLFIFIFFFIVCGHGGYLLNFCQRIIRGSCLLYLWAVLYPFFCVFCWEKISKIIKKK